MGSVKIKNSRVFNMTEHKENLGLSVPEIKLWHGNCLDLMKNIPDQSVDMVLTDPP